MEQEGHGWLPKGLRLRGKAELLAALRDWLNTSYARTIGDTSHFHGRHWATAEIAGYTVRLAADTTREAIQRVLDEAGDDAARPWRVIANERGPRE